MTPRTRRHGALDFDPASPLVKQPRRGGSLDVAASLRELVALHENGGDPYAARMPEPDPDCALGVLRHAETHAARLSGEARRRAALLRVRLWQYLTEQAPARQSAAVEDARASTPSATWDQLADALGARDRSAAHKAARRLKAAALGTDADGRPLRRTPQAATAAEESYAAAEAAARRRTVAAIVGFAAARARARALLQHRATLEAADQPDETGELWVAFWLETLEGYLAAHDAGEAVTENRQSALVSAVAALERRLHALDPALLPSHEEPLDEHG